MEDFFQVQEDIAQAIVEKLGAEILTKEKPTLPHSRQTDNVDAYQLYLRGRHYLDQRTSLDLSLSLYQKAIEIDPDYALAYSGMSYVHFYQILFDFKPPSTFIKAQEAANKAMSLDPNLGEAYIIDGIVYFYYYWNPQKALEQYQKSYTLNPNYDIVRIMAYYYSMMGKSERAIELARQAVEMDPLNLGAQLGLGEILYRSGVFDKAIKILEELLERFPGNKVAEAILAAAHFHAGHLAQARAYYQGESFSPKLTLFYYLPHFYYLLQEGEHEKAQQLVDMVGSQEEGGKWISPASKAMLYFGFGDLAQAATMIHQALTDRDPILWIINSEPTWKAFREHPRIRSIIEERFIRRW
jgi:tetratricopeptide (TPR) repeat protein